MKLKLKTLTIGIILLFSISTNAQIKNYHSSKRITRITNDSTISDNTLRKITITSGMISIQDWSANNLGDLTLNIYDKLIKQRIGSGLSTWYYCSLFIETENVRYILILNEANTNIEVIEIKDKSDMFYSKLVLD